MVLFHFTMCEWFVFVSGTDSDNSSDIRCFSSAFSPACVSVCVRVCLYARARMSNFLFCATVVC